MKVSVVITAYNEADVLGKAAESMLAQTYKDFELIFVDNGSTDDTYKEIQKWTKKDKRVRAVRLKENMQPGGGRNAGAKAAKGDILVFVDADMVFDKDYLKILTKPILDGKTIGTTHTKELVANPENIWARSWCLNRIPDDLEEKGSGVFRAVLKKNFLEAGGFDPKKGYFDDALGALGRSTPVPATCYHNNPTSLKEVFFHSTWVGNSLVQSQPAKTRGVLVMSWIILALVIGIAFVNVFVATWMVGAALLLFLLFLLRKTLPRMIAEKRPEYLFSIPVLWTVRLLGFYLGATGAFFRWS